METINTEIAFLSNAFFFSTLVLSYFYYIFASKRDCIIVALGSSLVSWLLFMSIYTVVTNDWSVFISEISFLIGIIITTILHFVVKILCRGKHYEY